MMSMVSVVSQGRRTALLTGIFSAAVVVGSIAKNHYSSHHEAFSVDGSGIMLTRDIDIAILSVCLSVCLSRSGIVS